MKFTFKNFIQPAFLFALFFAAACDAQNDEKADDRVMEAKNEATVRACLAAMDAGDAAKFDLYCAPDYQIYNPFLPQPGSLAVFKGLMQGQKTGFPDIKHEVVQLFSKGNMVCVRGVFKGTNTGSMQGNPPTGNRLEVPFVFTDEFDTTGKIKLRHVYFDTGAFNAQLMAKH